MDAKSHVLFTGTLLKQSGKNESYSTWGNAPDIDMGFLHRWYRHRISVIGDVFRECKGAQNDADRDTVALGIISHLYLDIFNGIIFPFGIWYPIYPEKVVINEVLEDIPKLLVEDLRKLSELDLWSNEFYQSSRELMELFASNWQTCEDMISSMLYRLIWHATGGNQDLFIAYPLYKKAIKDIVAFTGDTKYRLSWFDIAMPSINQKFEEFERDYTILINKTMERE
ncbi:MAG: hypothetical protein PHZ02_01480 [Desulfocapsaceae bacterium]|nr:hypothetical protein [Desulfocapsaceae bacterium]